MTCIYYRIDDRLIHGQVVTRWANYYDLKKIIIADDEVANDDMQKQVISMTAPSNIKVLVNSINESVNSIEESQKNNMNTLVLIKTPITLIDLQKKGVNIEEIIIGGMQFKEGKTKVTNTVYVSEAEKEALNELYKNNTELINQVIPDDRREDFNKMLHKA